MSESTSQTAHDKGYQILVNGEHKTVERDVLTYETVVDIAFPGHDPTTIYSVSFERAKEPPEGELVAGQQVTIKNGTEFDVTPTGKS
jgi:hypothetical protein